jgi:hypothetical protein
MNSATNCDKEREESRDRQLQVKGWERKKRIDSEVPDPLCHVEHKYFTVSHREI